MQLQQTEVALATASSAEHDWYRGAVRKLAQVDAAWVAVVLCYCAVFGGILIYSDFLPYTLDNNEGIEDRRQRPRQRDVGLQIDDEAARRGRGIHLRKRGAQRAGTARGSAGRGPRIIPDRDIDDGLCLRRGC
jgi:hypothetical protein